MIGYASGFSLTTTHAAMTISLYETYDAVGLAGLVAQGDVAPGELLDEALARVEALNRPLNAVTMIREDVGRRMIAGGLPDGPLQGVPFLLKDLGAEAIDFPSNNAPACLPTRDTSSTRPSMHA